MNSTIIDRMADDLSLDRAYIKSIINKSDFYYKKYTIPKRNGDRRTIFQASPELKSLQYWVRENILVSLPVSNAAFAYQAGDSIKRHANFHNNAYFIFHTDIENYFPSIHSKMLTDLLIKHKGKLQSLGVWYEDICETVAKICFKNDQLSIGTVSSPAISNIIAYELDEMISSYCSNLGYRYSRYADDIYISSNSHIPTKTKDVVEGFLRNNGFRINTSKTWFKSRKSRRKVTGLILTDTGRVSVGIETRKKIKSMIYNRLINGTGSPDVILGYLAYLKDVEPQVYNRYMIKYATYCNGDVISAIKAGSQEKPALIINLPEI